MDSVKEISKRVLPGSWLDALRRLLRVLRWLFSLPGPPPHFVKARAVKKYGRQYGIHTFVETGTLYGGMVNAVKDRFTRIYTIELDRDLYERARQRFLGQSNIQVIHGDSPSNYQRCWIESATHACSGSTLITTEASLPGALSRLRSSKN